MKMYKPNKRSKWKGLWKNDKKFMCSRPIDYEELKEYAQNGKLRLIVMENPRRREGTDEPQFVFAFGDNKSDVTEVGNG